MKHLLSSAFLAVTVFSWGCQPPAPGTYNPDTSSQSAALESTLVPVSVSQLGPEPLWPATCGHRYVVVTHSVPDATRFVAYGVEVPRNPDHDFAFIVEGSTATDLDAFSKRMDQEDAVSVLFPSAPPDTGVSEGTVSIASGQIGNPPPTDPPGATTYDIAATLDAEL